MKWKEQKHSYGKGKDETRYEASCGAYYPYAVSVGDKWKWVILGLEDEWIDQGITDSLENAKIECERWLANMLIKMKEDLNA